MRAESRGLAPCGLSNVHPAALIAHERDERVERLAGKIDRGAGRCALFGLRHFAAQTPT